MDVALKLLLGGGGDAKDKYPSEMEPDLLREDVASPGVAHDWLLMEDITCRYNCRSVQL